MDSLYIRNQWRWPKGPKTHLFKNNIGLMVCHYHVTLWWVPFWKLRGAQSRNSPQVHYHVHISLSLVLTLCEMTPVHTLSFYFCKIHTTLAAYLCLGLPSGSLWCKDM
jgi:hypothetical protein